MHSLLADWLRNIEIVVTPEILNARNVGITTLAKKPKDPLILDLVRLAFGRSVLEEAINHLPEIRKAFKDHDPTFLMRDNWAELQTLAFATLMTLLEQGESSEADLTAMAVECLTLAGTAPTSHAAELIEAARVYLDTEASRIRTLNPSSENPPPSLEKEISAFQKSIDDAGFDSSIAIEQLVGILKNISVALPSVSDLHVNQHILEEETQILWWFVGEYSTTRHVPITALSVGEACTVLSNELANLTHFHPGSPAARDLLARLIQQIRKRATTKVSLRDAINGTPEDWRRAALKGKNITLIADLCPGLEALRVSIEHPGAWETTVLTRCLTDASQPVEAADLAYHMYVEWTLLQRVLDFA